MFDDGSARLRHQGAGVGPRVYVYLGRDFYLDLYGWRAGALIAGAAVALSAVAVVAVFAIGAAVGVLAMSCCI